jgi:FkbM family methyltransferase
MKTLIYVGAHHGNSLANFVNHYDKIYAFEANPYFCKILKQRFASNTNVAVINAAVCDKHNNFITFNISKNNGDSSSILEPNHENELFSCIETSEKIKVPTVNLYNFCQENNIVKITTYISDLQGYDFIVLKTLKPLIDLGVIESIQCEVEKNEKPTIYKNPDIENQNKEKNFDSFLEEKYIKVAKGWGTLTEGKFEDVPENWTEHDIQWKLKTSI